jgi:hypothetical protein
VDGTIVTTSCEDLAYVSSKDGESYENDDVNDGVHGVCPCGLE